MYSQNIETKTGLQNAASAYGFILGQEFVLNKIKIEYPNLYSKTIEAEMMFKISLGKTKENLESLFTIKLPNQKFQELKDNILNEFSNLELDQDKAITFIEEVKNRSKGNIQSPIKEIILCYNFYKNPEEEYTKGFTKKFNTKGHDKSKGSDWTVTTPISWVAKEADRPNIIQKFISEGGYGNESIMLMIKDFPDETKITESEINSFFSEKEAQTMLPPESKFLEFKKMTFDGIKGGMLRYEITNERLNYKITNYVEQFMFIYNRKLYFVTCNLSAPTNDYPNLKHEKYSKLFKLVANSIVINQQYQK